MKSYEEMADRVKERYRAYETGQKIRRKRMRQAASTLCCMLLMLLLAVSAGYWKEYQTASGYRETPSTESSISIQPADNNKIMIYTMDDEWVKNNSDSANKMMICLLIEDFVPMDRAELCAYYGADVFPTIPEDLNEWANSEYGIYRRNGGIGEVYWDGIRMNFSNESRSRSVNLEMKKGSMPWNCCGLFRVVAEEEKAVINGVKMAIGRQSDGAYYTEFMYRNNGFRLTAEGLSQEELVAVLASLTA